MVLFMHWHQLLTIYPMVKLQMEKTSQMHHRYCRSKIIRRGCKVPCKVPYLLHQKLPVMSVNLNMPTLCYVGTRTKPRCSLCKLQCSLDISCLLPFTNQWNWGLSIIPPWHWSSFISSRFWGLIFIFFWRQVPVSIIWKLHIKRGWNHSSNVPIHYTA